jgi:hypothetical protein
MDGADRSQRSLASGFCADLADSKENIKRAELEFHPVAKQKRLGSE